MMRRKVGLNQREYSCSAGSRSSTRPIFECPGWLRSLSENLTLFRARGRRDGQPASFYDHQLAHDAVF